MKIAFLYKSKLALFSIQFLILTIFIVTFRYSFHIEFDGNIIEERQVVIQFLSNYIMYEFDIGLTFLYFIWMLVTLIPVIALQKIKRVIIMNTITFFFPNFFFYIFISKYSPLYFEHYGTFLFLKTLLLGLVIILFSFLLALFLKFIKKFRKDVIMKDISIIEKQTKSKCPYCGTEFNSIPIYCYKCSKQLIPDLGDNNGNYE